MRQTRHRGGREDWLAELAAVAVVLALGWAAIRSLERIGVPVPWLGGPGASAVRRGTTPSGATSPPTIAADSGSAAPGAGIRPEVPPRTESTSPAARGESSPGSGDVASLRAKHLMIPVRGVSPDTIRSDFHDARGQGEHEALDILAPRGQPVVAVEDGTIAKLFYSIRGGNTIYQFDTTGAFAYYYAHLERYEEGLSEGATVRQGQVIGYVGTSGNAPANTPHLHFAIFKLGPERHWWKGAPIDPSIVLR